MSEGLGLKAYRERKAAEDARREEAKKPRVQRFALQKDGDSAVVRFAQEVDFDAKNYDESRGIGFVSIFHNNGDDPKNGFKNAQNCTMESQGDCYACNRVRDNTIDWDLRKGWKQKEKFYINVIAGEPREVIVTENGKEKKVYFTTDLDDEAKEGTVYLLEQSTYNGIYDSLVAYFLNVKASKETITDKTFQITRKGSQYNDTSYSVIAVEPLPKTAKALSDVELYDIKEQLNEVPLAQQEAFFFKGMSAGVAHAPAEEREAVGAGAGSSTGSNNSW